MAQSSYVCADNLYLVNPYKPVVLFMDIGKHISPNRLVPGVTPQNAASHLGASLFAFTNLIEKEIKIKKKTTPDSPKNENGLIQMIRMGNFMI